MVTRPAIAYRAPLIWTNSKRTAVFFRRTSLIQAIKLIQVIQVIQVIYVILSSYFFLEKNIAAVSYRWKGGNGKKSFPKKADA